MRKRSQLSYRFILHTHEEADTIHIPYHSFFKEDTHEEADTIIIYHIIHSSKKIHMRKRSSKKIHMRKLTQ